MDTLDVEFVYRDNDLYYQILNRYKNTRIMVSMKLENSGCIFPDPERFPKLKALEYMDNFHFEDVPEYPLLEFLVCSYSFIKKLPAKLPNIKLIDCNGTFIKSIPMYDSLEELYCYRSEFILRIPHLKNLKKLSCHYKTILPNTEYLLNLEYIFYYISNNDPKYKRPIYIKTDRKRMILVNLFSKKYIREKYLFFDLF
jgi:hypothetical protein